MLKQEAIVTFDSKNVWRKGEVKNIVNQIFLKGQVNLSRVNIGDVFAHKAFHHPAVVIKKFKNDYFCLILSSTYNEGLVLAEMKHRFHDTTAYVTKTLTITSFSQISTNYMYSIEQSELRRLKKIFKEYLQKSRF